MMQINHCVPVKRRGAPGVKLFDMRSSVSLSFALGPDPVSNFHFENAYRGSSFT
jgi:hypothetical protein